MAQLPLKSSMELPKRLLVLYNGLKEIIEKYRPEAIAVEELFFNKKYKNGSCRGAWKRCCGFGGRSIGN